MEQSKLCSDRGKAHSAHRWTLSDHPIRCKTTDRFPPTTNPKPLSALQPSSAHRQTVPYHHPALFQDFHGSVSLLCTNYLDNSEAETKEDTYNPNSSILTAWTCWGSFPSANNEHGKLGMIHVRCALSGVLGRYERNLSFYSAYWIKNKH